MLAASLVLRGSRASRLVVVGGALSSLLSRESGGRSLSRPASAIRPSPFSSSPQPPPTEPPPLPSLPARTAAALAGAPVPLSAVFVPGAGRGLVVGRRGGSGGGGAAVEEGTTLLREEPLAAVPLASHVDGGRACVCYGCLRPLLGRPPRRSESSPPPPAPLADGSVSHSGEGGTIRTFCSRRCLDSSLAGFYALESRVAGGWSELEDLCRATGERFPRVVARHFSRSIYFSPRERAAREADEALSALCFARVSPPYPPTWVESHGAFVAGLERWRRDGGRKSSSPSPDVEPPSLDSWASALSRVHLNAFRVDAPWPATTREEMIEAMLSSLAGGSLGSGSPSPSSSDEEGEQAGTAVYAASSLANHSCCPSARPSFPRGDSTLALVATRPLGEGDEVTVSYVDESLGLRERRRALEHGYGFFCRCERCAAEEEEEGGGGRGRGRGRENHT